MEEFEYQIIDDWKGMEHYEKFFDHLLYSDQLDFRLTPTTGNRVDIKFLNFSYLSWVHHFSLRIEDHGNIQKPVCPYYFSVMRYVIDFCDDMKIPFAYVGRSALNIQYPSDTNDTWCEPHVDHGYPHIQMITYLNDSDGDTILYNRKKPSNLRKTFLDTEEELSGLEDYARITPKKGRVLLFDGARYHGADFCTKGARAVLVNTIVQAPQ